jgi:hypothetical protein
MNTTTTSQDTVRCTGCNRPLRSAKSRAEKIGRTCKTKARKLAAVLAAGFKPAAIEKAKELIEQGGIIPLRGRRVFQVVASNGIDTYKTAKQACSCPAGIKSRTCYHVVAAHLLAA